MRSIPSVEDEVVAVAKWVKQLEREKTFSFVTLSSIIINSHHIERYNLRDCPHGTFHHWLLQCSDHRRRPSIGNHDCQNIQLQLVSCEQGKKLCRTGPSYLFSGMFCSIFTKKRETTTQELTGASSLAPFFLLTEAFWLLVYKVDQPRHCSLFRKPTVWGTSDSVCTQTLSSSHSFPCLLVWKTSHSIIFCSSESGNHCQK